MMTLLKNRILPEGQAFHFARNSCSRTFRFIRHNHQFAEIFWIEDGSGQHVTENGTFELRPWELWVVLPDNIHTHRVFKPLTLVNIAFPAEILKDMDRRYYRGALLGRPQSFPLCLPVPDALSAWLRRQLDTLAGDTRNPITRDLFLLQLLKDLLPPPLFDSSVMRPAWVNRAIETYREQGDFSLGLREWAGLIGKSPEHLSREIRRHTGQSAMELINTLRLDHAARLLTDSGETLAAIAGECGYDSASWFYKQFKTRFGSSPAVYRKETRVI